MIRKEICKIILAATLTSFALTGCSSLGNSNSDASSTSNEELFSQINSEELENEVDKMREANDAGNENADVEASASDSDSTEKADSEDTDDRDDTSDMSETDKSDNESNNNDDSDSSKDSSETNDNNIESDQSYLNELAKELLKNYDSSTVDEIIKNYDPSKVDEILQEYTGQTADEILKNYMGQTADEILQNYSGATADEIMQGVNETTEEGILKYTADIDLRDTDGKGTDYKFTYDNAEYSAKYTTDNWRIYDSYKINNYSDITIICQALIDEHPIHSSDMKGYRDASDLAYEWLQHNVAYAALPADNTLKSNAKDVDLDPKDQGKSFEEIYKDRTGKEFDINDFISEEDQEKLFNALKDLMN